MPGTTAASTMVTLKASSRHSPSVRHCCFVTCNCKLSIVISPNLDVKRTLTSLNSHNTPQVIQSPPFGDLLWAGQTRQTVSRPTLRARVPIPYVPFFKTGLFPGLSGDQPRAIASAPLSSVAEESGYILYDTALRGTKQ